jgi:hypothetical protein
MSAEARDFAQSVAAAADRTLVAPEPWRPGAMLDDRSPALAGALAELGWSELAHDGAPPGAAGAAGVQLGLRLAPLHVVDLLLGGSPLAGELVRHAGVGDLAVDGRYVHRIARAEPVAYGDALGVQRVLASEPEGHRDEAGAAAWTEASVGYLAGLGQWALDQAVEYTRQRRAFGTVLAGLDPVQQRLADAATAVQGVRLLAEGGAGAAALAYAGPAVVDVTASCQQVVGAIGFTLEFPLQRAFRRARALQLWNESFAAA